MLLSVTLQLSTEVVAPPHLQHFPEALDQGHLLHGIRRLAPVAFIREACVANSSTYGFTPLVNKSWPIEKPSLLKAYFLEADLPVRFDRPTGGTATTPVTFAMHFGVAF